MPRLVNHRPKYRKHRASGQAIVTLGCRDFYLGPWKSAPSRAEYDRLTGEYLANGGLLPKDEALTVVELLTAFKRHAKGYYGPQARSPLLQGKARQFNPELSAAERRGIIRSSDSGGEWLMGRPAFFPKD
ncbi:MAG: hypothetical protein WD872_08950 [Pirellulaceae bacterium]